MLRNMRECNGTISRLRTQSHISRLWRDEPFRYLHLSHILSLHWSILPHSGGLCLLIVRSSLCSDAHIVLFLESFNWTYRTSQSLGGSDWVHDQPSWQYEDVISIIITWLVLCSLCGQLVLNFGGALRFPRSSTNRTSQTLGGSCSVHEVCSQPSWIRRCHFHDRSPILLTGLVLHSFRARPNLNLNLLEA